MLCDYRFHVLRVCCVALVTKCGTPIDARRGVYTAGCVCVFDLLLLTVYRTVAIEVLLAGRQWQLLLLLLLLPVPPTLTMHAVADHVIILKVR